MAGRRERLRFSVQDDVALLREILTYNPFTDKEQWESVQLHVCARTGKPFTLRAIQDHTERLLNNYNSSSSNRKDDNSVRKTSTEDESQLRDCLLQQVSTLHGQMNGHSSNAAVGAQQMQTVASTLYQIDQDGRKVSSLNTVIPLTDIVPEELPVFVGATAATQEKRNFDCFLVNREDTPRQSFSADLDFEGSSPPEVKRFCTDRGGTQTTISADMDSECSFQPEKKQFCGTDVAAADMSSMTVGMCRRAAEIDERRMKLLEIRYKVEKSRSLAAISEADSARRKRAHEAEDKIKRLTLETELIGMRLEAEKSGADAELLQRKLFTDFLQHYLKK